MHLQSVLSVCIRVYVAMRLPGRAQAHSPTMVGTKSQRHLRDELGSQRKRRLLHRRSSASRKSIREKPLSVWCPRLVSTRTGTGRYWSCHHLLHPAALRHSIIYYVSATSLPQPQLLPQPLWPPSMASDHCLLSPPPFRSAAPP